jgi:energy-coupling factor transporter ATP-binding protein EcfA2
MARRQTPIRLVAPYLRRIALLPDRIANRRAYPFDLPWLTDDFTLDFTTPVTIIIGENGTGKSTLVEATAALAGHHGHPFADPDGLARRDLAAGHPPRHCRGRPARHAAFPALLRLHGLPGRFRAEALADQSQDVGGTG